SRYVALRRQLTQPDPNPRWPLVLDELGRPAVLAGHVDSAAVGATLMASAHWRCVWFDPVAAVFVHDAYSGPVNSHQVDFAARHFRAGSSEQPHGLPALLATAKGLWSYATG